MKPLIVTIAMALAVNCGLMAQTTGPAAIATPAAHPSNGVIELIVTPILGDEHHQLSERVEPFGPWRGLIQIVIRNVSNGMAHLDEFSVLAEYAVEVTDSTGKPATLTEEGKKYAARREHPDPNSRYFGSISPFDLVPLEEITNRLDVSDLYRLEPGHAYKIRLTRTRGLPSLDEAGHPLKQREVSRIINVPEIGILRGAQ